ncbi:MAG: TonB-dependent receptor domain-containing protein [Janthinobacterium lividum]
MKTLYTFLLLLICGNTFAQNGIISGKILDQKQQPITGASVLLLHLPDSAKVAGQSIDENGAYRFKNSKYGKYIVKIVEISFITNYSKTFDFTGSNIDLPVSVLVEKKNTLKEVTVSSTIPPMEQKSDRLVVNVEKLSTTGDNVLEVLKKAPGIRLNKDDNILYRNNGSVVGLIDGRRTYMSGAELSNYLKTLPGNALSKVELIPNPPGNYDAEGTAGMINIILKHTKLQGYSGTANANVGYGKYIKTYGGLNLNYNTGKFSLFTRVNSGYYNSYNKLTLSRQIGSDLYNQYNLWRPKTVSTSYTLGTDFYASKKSTFGLMFKGYNNPTNAQFTSMSNTLNNLGEQTGSVTGLNPQKTNTGTYSLNLNYSLALDTTGQKLSFDADYVHSNSANNENYTNTYYNGNGALIGNPVYLQSDAPVNYNIKSIKADYILPLKKNLKFEAGLKSSIVNMHAIIAFDSLKTAGYLLDPKRSNDFVYDENINAAYATLSKTFNPQLDVKASLRTEQTVSTANSVSRNEVVKRNYWQLFLSAFVTYKVDADNQLNASFSRRISRPGYSNFFRHVQSQKMVECYCGSGCFF